MQRLLLAALAGLALVYAAAWFGFERRRNSHPADGGRPRPPELVTGFVTDFLDTLGIGNFAPTTAVFKLLRLVPDEQIPGTLNVGHALPVVTEALIYIAIVEVGVATLTSMIAAAVVGAWLGAGVVSRLPRRTIQVAMAVALLVAVGLMLLTQLGALSDLPGEALGLRGARLVAAILGSLVLGALMTVGIGFYAPCMIMVSLLGMNPTAAFPIMMGSCAFLMPVGSIRFIRMEKYHFRTALGLTVGGIPGVLLAAFLVKTLPLAAVRWLVVVVVFYAALMMLQSARGERREAA
jgi:uncharacterized membrane protein YfcA